MHFIIFHQYGLFVLEQINSGLLSAVEAVGDLYSSVMYMGCYNAGSLILWFLEALNYPLYFI